jgi:outer membrane receptor for ferrienterochelin and colicin
MKHILIALLLIIFLPEIIQAEEESLTKTDSIPFYMMSLEQLMNVNVSVASQVPMTNREAPGIVTIVTQDEIRKSGANDLIDFLKLVPGFDFGVDVDGVVGIGVRGNWANEGKVLLLWDGMEMNEDLYTTLQFGSHYPVDRIKRIEIIRGPGSAMYGGNAEYAVINIISFQNSDHNGIDANAFSSNMSRTFGSRGFSFSAGKKFGNTHINAATEITEANRSQQAYVDSKGNSYDMSNQSGLNENQYRLDVSNGGFSFTGMCDRYAVDTRDGYAENYTRAYHTQFNTAYLVANYQWKLNEKLKINPGIRYKFQHPWSYTKSVTDDIFEPYNTVANKKEYYINSGYNPNDRINITSGFVYYHQIGVQKIDTIYFSNGSDKFNIDNYAVFLQSIIKTKPVNIIFGCRYEYNTIYGSSLVPRLGLTRIWDNFHIKALYSNAFRSPSIENINAAPGIIPEKTSVLECEFGYRITNKSYLTANIYDITTKNPIVYYYDDNEDDVYINESKTGTRGAEIEYKWKSKGFFATVNYAFYTTAGHRANTIYSVIDHPDVLLAFPAHEINANSNIQLSEIVNVNASASFNSRRYWFSGSDDRSVTIHSADPVFYLNLALNFENIFCKGFSIQASCLNVLDKDVVYIQPYNGNHNPLPGAGREFKLRLMYSLAFKK